MDIIDRLIDYGRVFGSRRFLKNASSPNIQVNNLHIFGLPKGILHGPEFEVLLK